MKKNVLYHSICILVLSIVLSFDSTASTPIETEEMIESVFDIKTDIEFMGDVPNDVTGKWKWAKLDKDADPYDYAIDYCKEFCEEDGEVHAIINTQNNTTTCLNYSTDNGGSVTITVREYVKDEEKDAKILFTGQELKSRVIDISTGAYYDYDTGESGYIDISTEEESETDLTEITYILNTNTMKFHKPSCSSVEDIKEENRRDFFGTRDEAITMGYDSCGRCNP